MVISYVIQAGLCPRDSNPASIQGTREARHTEGGTVILNGTVVVAGQYKKQDTASLGKEFGKN